MCVSFCFILKIDHNIKSYQNMICNLGLNLFYYKLHLGLYVMYITLHFHIIKDS